ncbi:MAG: hypothetical protein KF893_10440 [Caldilineaceae bacterium]|nr:hypothetical protein [Caldilineaceae bacterium]
MLINGGFECSEGTYQLDAPQGGQMSIHEGWTVNFLHGTPWVYSANMQYNGGPCGGPAHVEKIEGGDSLAIFAHDLEWTDQPGKPFDVALYQQVAAIPEMAYSLSAWMLSLCGGSTMPNDCPDGYYMAKMLGIDPTGGIDPNASTVIWVEDRRNFVEDGQRVGWINLRLAAMAEAEMITVFARINSPFQWHGNHAFVDAFSLVEAPEAQFLPLPEVVEDHSVEICWQGAQSQRIELIPAGLYTLNFDIEYRIGEDGDWQPWLTEQPAGKALFTAQQVNTPHFFRVRPRAEQPADGPAGAWPNHRYPGVWAESHAVTFDKEAPDFKVFIPNVLR